jgi:hypothetical protein
VSRHNVYRDGKVHVKAAMCPTCIFRGGNLMALERGRVKAMVEHARANESTIVCHETTHRGGGNAVCRGFYERFPTTPLQLAQRLGLVIEQ